MKLVKCFICGAETPVEDEEPVDNPLWESGYPTCQSCKTTYPPALIKACRDEFHYSLKLRNSKPMETIDFTRARINGNWITIMNDDEFINIDGITCPRGFDVNISEIVWVVDAPS